LLRRRGRRDGGTVHLENLPHAVGQVLVIDHDEHALARLLCRFMIHRAV